MQTKAKALAKLINSTFMGEKILKIIVATDSYKGSLTSLEAGNAIADGIHKVDKTAEVIVRPIADGGEGTVEALSLGMGGRLEKITVTGPLGTPVEAVYGIVESDMTAIIEMSAAAGIVLVSGKNKNPLYTTTYGVGEMISDAIKKGCRRFIVGIGGSATNDGGAGMLMALGFDMLDADGNKIPYGSIGLNELMQIKSDNVIPELKDCTFKIACDVTNPLCGDLGCSRIYGPQKGATEDMIKDMDAWLANYAKLAKEYNAKADDTYPGSGAAGGMGFAFRTFLNGSLESGIKIVLEETKLESYVKDADLVITGEGRLDQQTAMGKAPVGVAQIAKIYGKPVIAFAGCVTEDATVCNEHGIDAFFPILRSVETLEVVMEKAVAYNNLVATVEQAYRLFRLH